MSTLPLFPIKSKGIISTCFTERGIETFAQAVFFINNLPYGRNADKDNLATVFTDGCGTCSTKHAVLKLLADENGCMDLELRMGIFQMNANNTPKTSAILKKYGLSYIPEAHNYLVYNGQLIDITFPSGGFDIRSVLLAETTIEPEQISTFKVAYHKAFMQKWLSAHPEIKYTPTALWDIREQCIAALSA